MELKTKHKRLLSLILAIIFALEPFSSSVGLAMEGGALNEELVHSEVFNKKDSTTYIVPGQDELGNKTNEVTLESNLDDNRLVVQKIDRNGSRLEGAKFGLYNSAEELVREDITNSQGRIDFGKLEKGLYSLKELEAPKGYVLSNDTYIIEVKEDGSLTWSIYRTKAQGRDLNNSIQVKGYNLENNRENVKLFADLLIEEKVQAGDFFTISLDSKLQNPKVANLYTESGLLLAEAKYDQETKTVKYVFTKIAEYESLLNFQISIEEMEMNTEEVLATNNNEFITTIGDKVEEPVLLDYSEEVKVEEGLEANFLNISSQITGMDWEKHTVEYTVSLNPNKNLINKGTSLEISNDSTSVLLNQLDTSIEIFRQDELTGQLVNITSEFNTNNFTADESILESFALDFDENLLNGSTIQIKVTSRFVENKIEETTKVGLRTNLSTMDGLDSVQSADYREKKIEAQVLSEIVIPVVNFEVDQVVELEAEVYEEEIEKEKSQVRQQATLEKLKQKEDSENVEENFGEIISEIMKPSLELPRFTKEELDLFEINRENLIEKEEELNHKESGKLENSLVGLVEGLLGRSQVAKSTQTVADPTNPTTDPTGTSTTDPLAQPVVETTQPTSISMFSASTMMASPMGLTTPTATTNAYNTSTDPSATTVGTNYGVYSVDVKDFHYWQNEDSLGTIADTTSKMDISIKVPKDAKAGDTFTLSLPPDFNIDSPLNSTKPVGIVYVNGDKTTSIIDIYYKTPNGAIPDTQNLQHYLEFRITDAGAKFLNASGQDYVGTFTIGGDISAIAKDGVAIQNPDGTFQRNLFDDIPYGLNILINQWAASAPTDTSITKTFTFDSSYNGSTTILKDQSTLLYGNKTAAGAPAGAQYSKSYSMEYFNLKIAYTNEVSYYDNGTRYAKFSYTLNGGKLPSPTTTTTTFTDNTGGTMTSKVYLATNGDPNTGAYIGPLTDITANASGKRVNGVTLTKNAAGAVTKIVTTKGSAAFVPVVYVEQTVKVSSTTGSLIVVTMTPQTHIKDSSISDVYFEAEIKPPPVANFVKVVKADRNGDGVLEEYGVTSSPATFRLLDEAGNVLQDNLQTDSKGLLTVSEIKAGVNYILEETSVPEGFKENPENNPKRIKFFVNETDNVVMYYDSQNNLVDTSAKGYVPVENKLENSHNTLTINKKDQDGNPLPGAEFAIINKDTGITVYRTSGQDGKITLLPAEFPKGHYIIRETKAPNGFDKSTEEKEFWVANGGLYYNTNPSSTASSINNIETANLNYNIEANKTGESFFGRIVNKLFSSFKTSTEYAEAEVDLPYEEATKNYNVGITYESQQGGEGAQTIRTHAPILTEAINPKFNQTFYVNPDGVAPTTSNSNTVFTIFGKELNSLGQPTSTPSATLLKDSEVRIYQLTSGTLPENPKDFNPEGGTYTVQDVTSSISNVYVSSNDTYQINFDGAFNTSPYPTYIVVLDGKAENNNTKVYSSASVINTAGNVEFPVIIFPNSGGAVSSSADRGWGSLDLDKYSTLGIPLSGAEFKIINNLTGEEAPFELVGPNGDPGYIGNIYYLENGIRPGSYTIVETKAPVDTNGPIYTLSNNLADRSWELTVDDKDYDGLFEYVLNHTNGLASNNGTDPRDIRIENIPSYRPLDLKLNLYTQDGSTPLSGGSFIIQKVGGNSEPFIVSGDNLHTVTLEEPGEYIITQVVIPTGYTNAEVSWKINVVANNVTGNLEVDVRQPYNYLKEVIVGAGTSKDTLDVLNKMVTARPLEIPPPYGEIPTASNVDISFDVTNTRNFKFILEKVDSENNKALVGAEFTLKNDSTGETIVKTTDGLGRITFEGLNPGTYTLAETKAPADYKANDATSTITIGDDGSVKWDGSLISTPYSEGEITVPYDEYVAPFGTSTVSSVGATAYPNYMQTKDYLKVTDPTTGIVNFYVYLNPNQSPNTDRNTRVNFYGDNLRVTNVQMYDVDPAMYKTRLNGYFDATPQTAENYSNTPIDLSSGADSGTPPITSTKGVYDSYVSRTVDYQIKIPQSRFGTNPGKWGFFFKVTAEVINPKEASSMNFNWLTDNANTSIEGKIERNIEINPLLETKYRNEAKLNYSPTLQVKNERLPGMDFVINKVDDNGKPLAGATFKLSLESDPNTFFEAVSTTEGKVSFSKIPYGTYILEETKVPEGYVKTSDTWRVVVSETGVSYYKKVETTTTTPTPLQEIPELTITNFKKPSVEFFKTTVIGTPLAGAKFQLYKKTGADGTATRMSVGGEVIVGTDGRIYFENLDVGNYELVETQAPVGYKKLEDPAVTFEVTDKGEVTKIYGKELDTSTGKNNIWNWRLPEMEVELKKLDGDLEAILEGNVEFKLRKASSNTSGGEVPSFLQTLSFTDLGQLQEEGKTLKFNIPPEMDGEYILEETKAPDGYIRSFDKFHIMISQAERTIKLVKVTNALGTEKAYRYIGADGKEVSVKLSDNPITLYSESSQGVKDEAVSLDFGVVNTKAVYPSTGGIGTLAFTIVGGAIMGGTLIKSRRKKEEEEDRE
ncbi:MAG: SpaA isopeptide-forming pilin-related protein [Finegoldia sp.]|nr:SpaA isopeptide-forming pilin-related protein [Finegoldia sp.]